MADRTLVKDKRELIVRRKAGRALKASSFKPIKTSKRPGPQKAFRVKIEALLAELGFERRVGI